MRRDKKEELRWTFAYRGGQALSLCRFIIYWFKCCPSFPNGFGLICFLTNEREHQKQKEDKTEPVTLFE